MSPLTRLLALVLAVVVLAVLVVFLGLLLAERALDAPVDWADIPREATSRTVPVGTAESGGTAEPDVAVALSAATDTPPPSASSPASALGASERDEGAVLAPTVPLYRVEGLLVDARTDEPVPQVEVSLSVEAHRETVTTDAAGRFRSGVLHPSGTLVVIATDEGRPLGWSKRELAPDALAWTFPVEVGPTVPVSFGDGIDLALHSPETWRARIVERARDDGVVGVIDVTAEGGLALASGDDALLERVWPWHALRPGELPWLRYGEVHHAPDERYEPFLELVGRTAGRRALVELTSTVGVQPPVRVDAFDRVVTLEGEVWRSGHGWPHVLLVPLRKRSSDMPPPMWHEDPLGGGRREFSFERVAPGSWRLVVWATRHAVLVRDLELRSGYVRLDPIRLQRGERTDLGLSYTGHTNSGYRLRLRAAGPFARAWHASSYEWSGDLHLPDGWSFAAVRSNLPEGALVLEHVTRKWLPAWRPYRLELPHPLVDDETVRAIAPEDTVPFRLHVVDAEMGEVLPNAAVAFGPGGAIVAEVTTASASGWRLTPDVPLEWSVRKEGYAPAFGTHADFALVDGERVARVELRRGWGAELLLRAAAGGRRVAGEGAIVDPPLPGVEILEGGRLLGRSDSGGAVRLALDHAPKRLELRAPGWRLVEVSAWRAGSWVLWMNRR